MWVPSILRQIFVIRVVQVNHLVIAGTASIRNVLRRVTMWGVADQGDNDCGKPCDSFLTDCSKVYVEAMCKGMGCTWHDNPLVSYCGDTFPL